MRIADAAYRVSQRNRDRHKDRYRRFKLQYGLKILGSLMLLTAVLCIVGPPIAKSVAARFAGERRVRAMSRQTTMKSQDKQPIATKHQRQEITIRQSQGQHQDILTGNFLEDGVWQPYDVNSIR